MTRVAPAAQSLLDQATKLRPARSKASDGTVGDRAHRNRKSDHNPDGRGIVHAADLTHDPKRGMDAHGWARWIARKGDRRIKYLISNRQIWMPGVGWSHYGGENPHDKHVHLSVLPKWENDTSPWFDGFLTGTSTGVFTAGAGSAAVAPGLGGGAGGAARPVVVTVTVPPTSTPSPTSEEDDMRVRELRYTNQPVEYWLEVGPATLPNGAVRAAAINLNQTTGEVGSFQRDFGSVVSVGDDDCNRWKMVTAELLFAEYVGLIPQGR